MEYLNTNFPGLKELLGENYQNKKEEVKFVPCSSQKILKMIALLEDEAKKLKKHLTPYPESPVYGDMRTTEVKRGNYKVRYKDQVYTMDTFTGVVTKIQFFGTTTSRVKVTIELRNNKRLSFFTNNDSTLKKNTIIEVVGVCLKPNKFYDFKCCGGYRRILTSYEIDQLTKGIPFEKLELKEIPWEIISSVRITEPISDLKLTSLF